MNWFGSINARGAGLATRLPSFHASPSINTARNWIGQTQFTIEKRRETMMRQSLRLGVLQTTALGREPSSRNIQHRRAHNPVSRHVMHLSIEVKK